MVPTCSIGLLIIVCISCLQIGELKLDEKPNLTNFSKEEINLFSENFDRRFQRFMHVNNTIKKHRPLIVKSIKQPENSFFSMENLENVKISAKSILTRHQLSFIIGGAALLGFLVSVLSSIFFMKNEDSPKSSVNKRVKYMKLPKEDKMHHQNDSYNSTESENECNTFEDETSETGTILTSITQSSFEMHPQPAHTLNTKETSPSNEDGLLEPKICPSYDSQSASNHLSYLMQQQPLCQMNAQEKYSSAKDSMLEPNISPSSIPTHSLNHTETYSSHIQNMLEQNVAAPQPQRMAPPNSEFVYQMQNSPSYKLWPGETCPPYGFNPDPDIRHPTRNLTIDPLVFDEIEPQHSIYDGGFPLYPSLSALVTETSIDLEDLYAVKGGRKNSY